MSLIVQKFGGTSVSNTNKLIHVAKIIIKTFQAGNDVVAVVSAQGHTTDRLIEKAKKINKNPQKRELDLLLSTGETTSAALLTMIIQNFGCNAIALTGPQAGFKTCNTYGNAKITKFLPHRIFSELKKNKIVVVSGFQGICGNGDITTLGRGGSDASAIKIAASLHADECKIFTDVDGVFTSDPNIVKNSQKIDELTFDEMIFISFLGAQVMNTRAVQIAKKYNVKFEILHNSIKIPGTIIGDFNKNKHLNLCSIAIDKNVVKFTLNGTIELQKILDNLLKIGVRPDMVLEKSFNTYLLIINKDFANESLKIMKKSQKNISITTDDDIAKISLIGSNFVKSDNILKKMVKILNKKMCNIHYFLEDEHRKSFIVTKNSLDLNLLNLELHKEFFE